MFDIRLCWNHNLINFISAGKIIQYKLCRHWINKHCQSFKVKGSLPGQGWKWKPLRAAKTYIYSRSTARHGVATTDKCLGQYAQNPKDKPQTFYNSVLWSFVNVFILMNYLYVQRKKNKTYQRGTPCFQREALKICGRQNAFVVSGHCRTGPLKRILIPIIPQSPLSLEAEPS